MSKIPLLAFAPTMEPIEVDYEGTYRPVNKESRRMAPVGYLSDFLIEDDLLSLAEAEKVYAPFGLKPKYVAMGLPGKPQRMGVSLSIGVFFDDIEDALKVPGFAHLATFTGCYDLTAAG